MAKKHKAHFTVNRAKWLTGEAVDEGAADESVLRDPHTGLMCCLGQFCRQLKIKASDIDTLGTPEDLGPIPGKNKLADVGLLADSRPYRTSQRNTKLVWQLMNVNDAHGTPRKYRERKIRLIAAKHGLRVTFTGRYPDYSKIAKRLHDCE